MPKGVHARGYALQLKIKHCWKLFLFKMLCCVLAWMNEYIVQIISATRLWLISRYSHHTLKKRRKMTAKNGHPCTEWFSSLYLQTNREHIENQSLFCTRKTLFYTDNITSTLTIVVFSINWSRMFALYVRQMCCKLKLKTLNNRKTTASLRNHRKRRVCSDPCICTTQRYSGVFFSEVLHEIWRIFPQSFDIVVISDVPTRYLIFCTKQTRKQSLFLSTTSGTSRDLSQVHSFSRPHGVSLFGNIERCVVVSFSGAMSVQWSDVEHALCAFSGVCEIIFKFSANLGVRNESTVKSGIFPRRRFETCFLYLAEYSMKNFITTKQYLVNLTCNCWFRMCAQFHQKLISYKCMLFVDCLVVLREYFVNWARVTKL